MFNLDHAIKEWRRQLAVDGLKTNEDLNELESHLRDDVAAQLRTGPAVEQAFATAVQRIGRPRELIAEFAKAPRRAPRPKLLSLAAVGFVGFIGWLSTYTFTEMNLTLREQTLALAAVGLTLLIAFSLRYIARYLPAIPNQKLRLTVGIGLTYGGPAVWGLFASGFILPHLEPSLTSDQMLIAVLWLVVPGTFLSITGLGLALGESARTYWGMIQHPGKPAAPADS